MKTVYVRWVYASRPDGTSYRCDLAIDNPDLIGDPYDKDIKFVVVDDEPPRPQEPEINLESRVECIYFLYGMRYFNTESGFKAWKSLPWYKRFKKHEDEED